MRTWLFKLGIVVAVALSATLFAVQNGSRSTELSFDLGFAAWRLVEPVSIPALMGVCLAVGLTVGLGLVVPGRIRLAAKVRALERDLPETPPVDPTWR